MNKNWKWFGYALHSPIGDRCAFHLGTVINDRIIISTIGHWIPKNSTDGKPENVGPAPEHMFETMVFELAGYDERGRPQQGEELHQRRYLTAEQAQTNHTQYCEIYSNG